MTETLHEQLTVLGFGHTDTFTTAICLILIQNVTNGIHTVKWSDTVLYVKRKAKTWMGKKTVCNPICGMEENESSTEQLLHVARDKVMSI